MKEIQLTQGKTALVDDEDFEVLIRRKWHAKNSNGAWYAQGQAGGKDIKMHREIMNCPEDLFVDHIDGNGLNNQRNNLRICTKTQNNQNAKLRKDNKAGFKGVEICRKRFRAHIGINSKKTSLGMFDNAEDAAREFDRAAKEKYGVFARLNFPETK